MKTIRLIQISLVAIVILIFSCSKEEPNDNKTPANTLAVLSTTSISSITTNSANSGGNITNDGGASVSARGVCWSTSSNPTISNFKTSSGSGTGSFSSSLSGLSQNTTYYVRAYATNSVGTSYGNQVSFKTLTESGPNPPTVSTSSVTSITTTSAVSGGNISSDGGASVTARGVCWSTSSNPTTSNTKTVNGTGTGSFSSSITGLSQGTSYYVRAYATNSAGTSYGSQLSFTSSTPAIVVPTISTSSVASITVNSASSGGNITNNGGAAVTARGVCWNTSGSPTIANSKTSNGTGSGSFSSSITGLSGSTTYYVRAYATNSAGTAYGNQVNFTTNLPAVAPNAPHSLTANAPNPSTISLSWTDNSLNETGFEIQRKHPSFGTWVTVTTVGANVQSYTHSGLSETWPGYRVRAVNAAGSSAYTAEALAPAKIRIINNLYSSTPSSGNDWARLNAIARVRIGPSSSAVVADGNTYERLCPYDMLSESLFVSYADWIPPAYNSTSQYEDFPVSTYGYGSNYYLYLECGWWDYIVVLGPPYYWQKTRTQVLCNDGTCCCYKWAWTQITNHSSGYFVISATDIGLPVGSWNNTIKGSNEGKVFDAKQVK